MVLQVNKTILQKNYWKMNISWSLSYNHFIKFHGKKNWKPHDCVISGSHMTVLYLYEDRSDKRILRAF